METQSCLIYVAFVFQVRGYHVGPRGVGKYLQVSIGVKRAEDGILEAYIDSIPSFESDDHRRDETRQRLLRAKPKQGRGSGFMVTMFYRPTDGDKPEPSGGRQTGGDDAAAGNAIEQWNTDAIFLRQSVKASGDVLKGYVNMRKGDHKAVRAILSR